MEITKHLLLNLSLVLVLLFFMQMLSERWNEKDEHNLVSLLYFILSIFTCFVFSVQAQDGIYFDLRQVPLILGILYTGNAFLLAVLTILMRGFIGIDEGFWVSAAVFIMLSLLLKWLHGWFIEATFKMRMAVSVLINVFTSFILLEMITVITKPVINAETWISFIFIPAIAAGIISYSIETLRHNALMRQKLAKAEKIEAVSHMSAAISHEIRNPLTTVKGFLQLLKEEEDSLDKRKEFIEIAVQELDRAEQVISDYLTFARPSIDQVEEIELHKELAHVLNILQPMANMNGIEIVHQLSRDLKIQGDRQKFTQGFINLIKNGLEAMPDGGTLTVRTSRAGNSVKILVSDTGIGMSEEQLDRLGEPYYSTKGKKGTGLGMMVTYSIIRAMNGKVEVTSMAGKGTSFIITFPVI
ncbi:sensor histidine kinase [Bacillus sp. T33-2]|uniref:sensor histidine kinase n=1 Tax=Bacillus sp. T33-2 TaxID=2054168 RepID=UPI000C75AD56|nr:HAMP domain-containing sensor histidine kinase [Bacillus sp. T33-2]PLR94110.1 histidine kinase [Bacillus sp. T33-2]